MAAVPTPLSALAGKILKAADWIASVYNVLTFLLYPPLADCYNVAGISLANGSATLLTWDTESRDDWSMHSTTTNPSRVTALYTGRYAFKVFVSLPSVSTTYTQFDINPRVNAAGSSSGGTSVRTFRLAPTSGDSAPREGWVAFDYVMTAGDYIEVFVTQTNSGSAARTTEAAGLYATGFQMRWAAKN